MSIQISAICKEKRADKTCVFNQSTLAFYLLYWYFLVCLLIQPAVGYLSEHLGLLPEVKTGWALVKVVLLGLVLLLGSPWFQKHIRGLGGFWGTLLVLWVLLLQVIHSPLIIKSFPSEARQVLGNTALTGPGLWLVGLCIIPIWQHVRARKRWQALSWGFFITYVSTLVLGIATAFHRYGFLWGVYRNPKAGISYIEIADGLAIMTFWMASLIGHRRIRNLFLALVGMLLFFTLSRASFYAYMATLSLLVLFRARWSVRILYTSALVVIIAASYGFYQIPAIQTPYRILAVIQNPYMDESLQLRAYYFAKGLERLSDHWLLGNFMAEVILGEGQGTYIHNWLSFWEAYGLGPFVLSLGVFAIAVLRSIKLLAWKGMLSGVRLFFVGVCFYCIINVIVARAYVWPYIWLVIGMIGTPINLADKMVNKCA